MPSAGTLSWNTHLEHSGDTMAAGALATSGVPFTNMD